MSEQWYYARAGKQAGPVSAAELKQLASAGQLSPTDHVWKNGMAKWELATKVKGLFSAPVAPMAQAVPSSPPVPAAAPVPTAASVPAAVPQPLAVGGAATAKDASRTSSRRLSAGSKIVMTGAAVLLFVVIGVGGFIALRPAPGAVAEKRTEPRNDDEQLVKQFILNNVNDPKGVRFVSWGPHMLAREVQELRNAGATEFPVYRDRSNGSWSHFYDREEGKGEKAGEKGTRPLSFIRVRYRLPKFDFSDSMPGDKMDHIIRKNASAALKTHFSNGPPKDETRQELIGGAWHYSVDQNSRDRIEEFYFLQGVCNNGLGRRDDENEIGRVDRDAPIGPGGASMDPVQKYHLLPTPNDITYDRIFAVVDGNRVEKCGRNIDGDGWKKEARRELAKTCPRITPE